MESETVDRSPDRVTRARICFLSFCPALGGIANYQALQIQYLSSKVPVLFLGERPRNTFKSIERGGRNRASVVTAPIWTRPLGCFRLMSKVLFAWRPTVVVVSNLGLMIVWAPLLRWLRWRTGCEILHVYHSRRTTPSLKGYLLEFLTSFAHLNASSVVYVSDFTKRAWESAYPWMRFCSARVVPNAVPIAEVPARSLQRNHFTLGFIGRLEGEKGARLFCEIARELSKHSLPFRFELFGDGSLRDELVSEFGAFVHFNGIEHDKDELLGKLDLLVVTSRIENAPYAVLEAKARGIPVVSARIGGIPEIVEDGIDGVLCDSRAIQSYSGGIISAYENFAQLQAGCMRNRSKFDMSRVAPAMWEPFMYGKGPQNV